MTTEQAGEFYSRAVLARIHYMNDVRMSVWAEHKDLDRHYGQIVGRR